MIRKIFLAIFFSLLMITYISFYLIIFTLKLFRCYAATRKFVIFEKWSWSKFVLWGAGVKHSVEGMENLPTHNNICYIANHQSLMDVPVIMYYIRRYYGFVAKQELRKFPIFYQMMLEAGCVLIDRSDKEQAIKAIEERAKRIPNGDAMAIFPEGTRNKEGGISKFRQGGFRAILKENITIVPLTVTGTHVTFSRKNKITPTVAKLTIHKPIDSYNLTDDEKGELIERVELIIRSASEVEVG